MGRKSFAGFCLQMFRLEETRRFCCFVFDRFRCRTEVHILRHHSGCRVQPFHLHRYMHMISYDHMINIS